MNIILVPLLLPRNFSPFGKHAWYPLSRTTDVHRSTNRRNKIPNYPWKNHDKIVRNWHPSICIRVHRSFTPSIDLCRTNVWRTNLLPFQRNKTPTNTHKNASTNVSRRKFRTRYSSHNSGKKSNIDSRGFFVPDIDSSVSPVLRQRRGGGWNQRGKGDWNFPLEMGLDKRGVEQWRPRISTSVVEFA